MKIWIDDIRNAPDDSWNVCRTVQSAIKAIHQFGSEITDISFDHDISHHVGIGVGQPRPMPCGETFQSVAHYVGLFYSHNNNLLSPSMTIHSANPTGAQEIRNILLGFDIDAVVDPLPQANRLETIL